MGSGAWDPKKYEAREAAREAAGISAFDFSERVLSGRAPASIHPDLDPFGVKLRESRDSDEHPFSTAVAVLFDVTGSMREIPGVLRDKLKNLDGLVRDKRYLADPQFMFGAIGDASCDRFPLQVGQFESDNRMDQNLESIILEGGGGGPMSESYELGMYFMARHTAIDCFEKRGQRGYLFLMGDEMVYPTVNAAQVQSVIGEPLTEQLTTVQLVRELQQRYHVYFIMMNSGAWYGSQERIYDSWKELLGQSALKLDDPNLVCETIGMTIGLTQGAINMAEGLDHLKRVGTTAAAAESISRAVATLDTSMAVAMDSTVPGLIVPADTSTTSAVSRL